MPFGVVKPPPAGTLKTGQTVQYSGKFDDGYYEQGRALSYAVLDAGQYAGTVNVDVGSYVSAAGDISFHNNDPAADTIASVAFPFNARIQAGDVLVISGATDAGNNRVVTVAISAANLLTLTESNVLTTRDPDPLAISIAKREAHSNACVLDLNTGLMWSRTPADKMGPASDGKMLWLATATDLADIFAYVAACNTALLAGYNDWRVPNVKEAINLVQVKAPGATLCDATAFPGFGGVAGVDFWTSTTEMDSTGSALTIAGASGGTSADAKNAVRHQPFLLVRGG